MPLATPSSVHSERCTIVPRRRYIKSRDGPHIDGKSESRSSSHLFPSCHFSVPRYKPKVPAPSRQPRSCVIAAARRGDLSGWMSTGQSISGGSAVRTGRSTSSIIGSGPPCYSATASAERAHAARDPTRMPAIHNRCHSGLALAGSATAASTSTPRRLACRSAATGSKRPRSRGRRRRSTLLLPDIDSQASPGRDARPTTNAGLDWKDVAGLANRHEQGRRHTAEVGLGRDQPRVCRALCSHGFCGSMTSGRRLVCRD